MSISFDALKRNSKQQAERLQKELQKTNGSNNNDKDSEEYWSCTMDKAGNGSAVIRFLPAPPQDGEEGLAFVKLYKHAFKGPGGWYIENSLTTLGKPDPVAEMNSLLWAEGEGSPGRLRVKGSGKDNPGTKRQLTYVANIYVVEDPANPENEGKVFKFKYGKAIHSKIQEAIKPEDPDVVPIPDPFNLWTGANFRMRIRRKDGYANYDLSKFAPAGPLFDSDEEMERVWKSQYSLQELIDPSQFKSYDELKKRLERVEGFVASGGSSAPQSQRTTSVAQTNARTSTRTPVVDSDDVPWEDDTPKAAPKAQVQKAPAFSDDDDDDDTLEFFRNLQKK